MQYTTLGRSGLKVSRLVLGTMNFGDYTEEKESFRIMDRALEVGINCFDSADFYGAHLGHGETESLIGRWLAQGGRREKIVLATKVYATMGPGVNDRGLSAYHLRRGVRQCMQRLQTDHIDLLQFHHVDRGVRSLQELKNIQLTREFDLHGARFDPPWEEIADAMQGMLLRDEISYIGTCNMPAWQLTRANMALVHKNMFGIISEQSIYNLANRAIEREVLPAASAQGIGVLAWSPLAAGTLAGKPSGAGRRQAVQDSPQKTQYEDLCAQFGLPPAEVALAWLLSRPGVTAPIIGPRTMAQLESSLRALELHLPDDMLQALDAIFPPVGEAPEAYSW